LSDEELDEITEQVLELFPNFGRRMLNGHFRFLGHHVPRSRILESYARVHGAPTTMFGARRIRRQVYSVPAPNSLYHHDGQHGFSVHNIRIKRLWRNVTQGFGRKWKLFFQLLEVHHDLKPNLDAHIWLLHHVFLDALNEDAIQWAEAWNHHRLCIPGGGQRSPRWEY
ncbi:uncharacterized protein F5891DRAFT_963393, partial [Suillus fuscotomentosus]